MTQERTLELSRGCAQIPVLLDPANRAVCSAGFQGIHVRPLDGQMCQTGFNLFREPVHRTFEERGEGCFVTVARRVLSVAALPF